MSRDAGGESAPSRDDRIREKVGRVEEIIERLESGEPSLAEGRELLAEGREHLEDLEALLDVGDGTATERD